MRKTDFNVMCECVVGDTGKCIHAFLKRKYTGINNRTFVINDKMLMNDKRIKIILKEKI